MILKIIILIIIYCILQYFNKKNMLSGKDLNPIRIEMSLISLF